MTDETATDIEVIEEMSELPAVSNVTSILEVIARAARDPQTDVDKLERLMAMHERMEATRAEGAFNAAMSKAQSEMRPVAADASNPQTHSKYASYAALDRALRPIYTDLGFSLSFDSNGDAPEGYVNILCYVGHKGGHTRTYRAPMPSDGKGAKGGDVMTKTHALGSAFTYGQRYLLKMIFNVAVGEDDDGNSVYDVELVSHEQLDKLRKLLDETGADIPKFCKYMRIANLTALPAAKFDKAIAALNKKKGGEK